MTNSITKKNNIPIACGLCIKSDRPDVLKSEYESYFGDDVVEWFGDIFDYYNKQFKKTI